MDDRYATAFLDWAGCAIAGMQQPAARAALASGDRVLALGTAGHVLDYDDTYAPGLAHLSAPIAPAALVTAAETGATCGQMLESYAAGFEAMGAVARASHPALYDRGWHPTAVCGVVGASVAAANLLGAERERAIGISLLRAGGFQAAFGSDGKSLQVGMAASIGVTAARLAAHGASVPLRQAAHGPAGFEAVFGGTFSEPVAGSEPAIERNWIKAWPCCLQTHSSIEAAERARVAAVELEHKPEVTVHPISLRAAAYGPQPVDGLQAKFSIPYLVAYTLARGAPRVESFEQVDLDVAQAADAVQIRTDPRLGESEALLSAAGHEFRVTAALGSPQRPMDASALSEKLERLAGPGLSRSSGPPRPPGARGVGPPGKPGAGSAQPSCCRCATAAACVRLDTPSLERIRETWTLAVFSAMYSA